MIKKIILLLFIILVVTGCSFENKDFISKRSIMQQKIEKDYIDPYALENPIILGLYLKKNETRTLLTTYESEIIPTKDIISLEVYYTKEVSLTGNQKELWKKYYQNYSNIDNYKIGYHIHFKTKTTIIDELILNSDNTNSFSDYINIYLYDNINQSTNNYLTKEQITEDTIITSIKLTAGNRVNNIISDIIITAFTYNENEEDINYEKTNNYQVTIITK